MQAYDIRVTDVIEYSVNSLFGVEVVNAWILQLPITLMKFSCITSDLVLRLTLTETINMVNLGLRRISHVSCYSLVFEPFDTARYEEHAAAPVSN